MSATITSKLNLVQIHPSGLLGKCVKYNQNLFIYLYPLFPFSALTLLVGRQELHPACKKTEWWDVGVVVWDEVQTSM